jgi:hypothetical protein
VKLLGFLAAVALIAGAAQAATFFVWNYDPVDRFYDPEVGDSIDCAYWVEQVLTGQDHAVTVDTILPGNLAGYDAVFCLMGWYRC